ncbi:aminoacyl-tRNA hydrolase [Paenalcaligenes niemegkensis]|uniref:alternative ribosome rescue aminoacyl-tRNA hydrolase ArfB n=1 Tax=Paenalcaligenes niemegkensis TaxID=2895469 RepID=UPI001EE88804|nr:alternative ribosome rescue aminoacyl-tRNA hydrolase ArfB [Paenalcaligenes niemegkensis]MCQ9616071.1 aminoacyl-tRNA hydrolase [Paenalcaligenes niemegkensis]
MNEAFTSKLAVNEDEVVFTAIRSQGAGGQNVNKVSSAVHLRFDIAASSLPEPVKARLLALRDHRITGAGEIVIKAQNSRRQEQNKIDALARLQSLIDSVASVPKARRPTRPTLGSKRRRLEQKTARAQIKQFRSRIKHP